MAIGDASDAFVAAVAARDAFHSVASDAADPAIGEANLAAHRGAIEALLERIEDSSDDPAPP